MVLGISSLALLAFPAAMRWLGQRMAPAEWARVVLGCLVLGAGGLQLALVLIGMPTVLRAGGVPELAAACERMSGALAPGGPAGGWLATAAALVSLALATMGMSRARRAWSMVHVEAALGEHQHFDSHEVVILATDRLLAMSVPGQPPQIVLSRGLVEALPDPALAAVLRHEEAHLRYRHDRSLLVSAAVDAGFGVLPFVRRSARVLRLAVERWADEEAAGPDAADRATVRDALVRVGATFAELRYVASFSNDAILGDRLDALTRPVQVTSWVQRAAVYVPASAFVLVATAGLGAWVRQAHMMISMAGLCRL